MKTLDVINQSFKDKTDYYDKLFRIKLNEALHYRGIDQKEFAFLCNKKSQNAAAKWVSLNDKYKTRPNAPELMGISDILKLDLNYFKDKDMTCVLADLTKSTFDRIEEARHNSQLFTRTSVVDSIFFALERTRKNLSVAVLSTVPFNGTSRALAEYAAVTEAVVYIEVPAVFSQIEKIIKKGCEKIFFSEIIKDKTPFLVFNNAEVMSSEDIRQLISKYHIEMEYPMLFAGKKIKEIIMKASLNPFINDFFSVGPLSFKDVRQILKNTDPSSSEEELYKKGAFLVGGIHEIMNQLYGHRGQTSPPMALGACENLKRLKILLVDNSPVLIDLIKERLAPLGHHIVEAFSGQEAVDKLEAEENRFYPFDLVMSEYTIPEVNGALLIKKAKKLYPEIKAAIITSCEVNKELTDLLNKGAVDGFIDKRDSQDKLLYFISMISSNRE